MSTRGLTVSGVPVFPSWLLFLKFAILGLSFIILALAAYATSLFGGGASAFLIFVALKTLIVFGATVALERVAPHQFYRVIFLVLYLLGIIFWLSAWAWAASSAAVWITYMGSLYAGQAGALAACAGLGALVWVMCIVHLAFFIRACLATPSAAATPLQSEFGQPKPDQAPAQYPPNQYPQPQYGQSAPYTAEQQQQQPYSPQSYPTQQFSSPDQYPTQQYPAPAQYPQQQPYQAQYQQPYASQ